MAVGAAVLAAIAELIDAHEHNNRFKGMARWGAYLALPTLIVGLVASMFHLNNPFSFVNGILNFGSSWISREGIFGILFLILAASYALAWFMADRGKGIAVGPRVVLSVLTAVAALCLICSTGMAYAIVRPIPAWNTPLTIVFFIVSACAMGTLLVGSSLVAAGKVVKGGAKSELWISLQALPQVVALLVLALMVVEGLRLLHLGTTTDAAVQSLSLLGGSSLALTLVRWIMGLALPTALMLYAWLGGKTKPELVSTLVVVSLVCVLVGEAVARVLFFLTAVHI
jgi:anaerobic dimethyl sulfoxide reductase subunit C (anchor subunit)